MLLVLACANVALLMFARAATRESEIDVRDALGASRGRIIMQLFVEALVLAGLAVAVGLSAARLGLKWFWAMYEADSGGRLPFWFSDTLTPTTVLYACLLAVLGALIAGVLPGLRVTDGGRQRRLQRATAGGGGFRFGGVWTAVIVAQVAATVAFPSTAFFFHRWVVEGQTRDVGFPAQEYLSARLEMDREAAPGVSSDGSGVERPALAGAIYTELERRLAAEPGVVGVTFADRLPGTLHASSWMEVDGQAAPPESPFGYPAVTVASVDIDFLDVLGAPILSGRRFTAADLESDLGVVIVNQSFVDRVFGGRDPVGRRVRRAGVADRQQEGPWLEVVGVVRDLGMVRDDGAGFYHPVAPADVATMHVAVHVRGDPGSFAPRLRTVAGDVDPTLRLHELLPLDEVGAELWLESQFLSRLLALLSSIALLLSLTAIYSVMAFTVSRRARAIGVRLALGADARGVIMVIFRRPLMQIGLGVLVGGGLVGVLSRVALGGGMTAREAGLVVAYAALMLAVCLIACIVPTRRALRVDPAEVLRAAD